jgi:hypothetical protein
MKCRNCGNTFSPVDSEATRLFHAHRVGFCSVDCDKKWGRNYDDIVPYKNKYSDEIKEEQRND